MTCNTAPKELHDGNPMVVASLGQRISEPSVSVMNPASHYYQSKRLVRIETCISQEPLLKTQFMSFWSKYRSVIRIIPGIQELEFLL